MNRTIHALPPNEEHGSIERMHVHSPLEVIERIGVEMPLVQGAGSDAGLDGCGG
jgi:hypothetical protein